MRRRLVAAEIVGCSRIVHANSTNASCNLVKTMRYSFVLAPISSVDMRYSSSNLTQIQLRNATSRVICHKYLLRVQRQYQQKPWSWFPVPAIKKKSKKKYARVKECLLQDSLPN